MKGTRDGWAGAWTDIQMDGWAGARTDIQMDGCRDGWTDIRSERHVRWRVKVKKE